MTKQLPNTFFRKTYFKVRSGTNGLISKHLKRKFWIWGPLKIWHNLPRDPNFFLNLSLHPCEGTGQPHYTLPDPTFKRVQSTTAISTAVTIYLYLLWVYLPSYIFLNWHTCTPTHWAGLLLYTYSPSWPRPWLHTTTSLTYCTLLFTSPCLSVHD